MKTLNLPIKPFRVEFLVDVRVENRFRPDHREIAKSLAKELIASGAIVSHEPLWDFWTDAKRYRFTIWVGVKEEGLP